MGKKKVEIKEKEVKNNISPFKSMLREDIDIFLSIDEMGENINIEGEQYIGVIEHIDKDFSEEAIDDIYYSVDLILYLKTAEFLLTRRKPGKRLKVNNTVYLVNDWFEEEGMTIIRLKESSAF